MQDIDLNLLPVLRVLLEEGNVTRAAERLHLSVSATSRALERARRTFADPLLVRRGRGVVATPAALELLPRLIRALDELDSALIRAHGFDPANVRQTLQIRAGDAVVSLIGPRLAATVAQEAPSAHLRFQNETDHDINDIRDGIVDLGVGSYGDLTGDLDTEELLYEPLVGVVRVQHPLAGTTSMSLPDFAALHHVVISRRGRSVGAIDEHLSEHGLRRKIVAVVPSTLTALLMVHAEDTTTIAPARVIATMGTTFGLHQFALPVPTPHVSVIQAWHRRYTTDPTHQWLRSCVRRATQAPDQDHLS